MPKAIHLFAGNGSMTKALQKAGISVVWALEEEPEKAEIYRANCPEVPLFQGDAMALEPGELPKFDLLAASVPGMGRESLDVSGTAGEWECIDRILRAHMPQCFCLEISRLHFLRFSEEWEEFIRECVFMGYQVRYQELDNEKHGGVSLPGTWVYMIGLRDAPRERPFAFPGRTRRKRDYGKVFRKDRRMEKDCYRLPEKSREYLEQEIRDMGRIYHLETSPVMLTDDSGNALTDDFGSILLADSKEGFLEPDQAFPELNRRNWYQFFVRDMYGVRKLSVGEYFELQGYPEFHIPKGWGTRRVLTGLRRSGSFML